jgi:hypothetical protein
MAVSSTIFDVTGASLSNPDNKIQFSLGQRASGDYAGVYIYGKALAAFAIGDIVYFDKDFNAAALTTAASPRGAKVAVAKMAMAAGQWGWFQVGGEALIKVIAASAVNTRLNSTATAGGADTTGTVGSKELLGMVLTVAAGGAGTAEGVLTEPFVNLTL